MSYFKGLKLTKLGETLLANINGNLNETLTFTSGEIGAGTINSDDEIRFLTTLKEKWKDLDIISIEKDEKDETIVKLELQFSNIDLKEAKIFREIGIYAKGNNGEPVLFAYSNAGKNYDYIPLPQDNPQNFTIEINLKITSNSKIDAIINMAGFVTIGKMVEFLKSKLTQIPTVIELQSKRNLKVGDIVEVLGYYTAGDGAGHKRIIANEDDGSGVQLNNKLWANIVHNGEVNIKWLGAKGDGVTDDTNSFKTQFNLFVPVGTFLINNTIKMQSGNHLRGENMYDSIIKVGSDVDGIWVNTDCTLENLAINSDLETYNSDVIKIGDETFTEKAKLFSMCGVKVNNISSDFKMQSGTGNLFHILSSGFRQDGTKLPTGSGYWGLRIQHIRYKGYYNRAFKIESIIWNNTKEAPWLTYSHVEDVRGHKAITGIEGVVTFETGDYNSNSIIPICKMDFNDCNFESADKTQNGSISNGILLILSNVKFGDFHLALPGYKMHKIYYYKKNLYYGEYNTTFGRNVDGYLLIEQFDIVGYDGVVEDFIKNNIILKSEYYFMTDRLYVQENPFLVKGKKVLWIASYSKRNLASNQMLADGEINFIMNFTSATEYPINKICGVNFYYNFKRPENTMLAIIGDCKNVPEFVYKENEEFVKIGVMYFEGKTNILSPKSTFIFGSGQGTQLTLLKYSTAQDITEEEYSKLKKCDIHRTGMFTSMESDISKLQFKDLALISQPHLKKLKLYNSHNKKIYNISLTEEGTPAQLNTLYHAEKMKQEGVYNDFITYMDEKTAYDKQQEKLEKEKQLVYEQALKENPNLTYEEFMSVQPMTLNLVEEPQPSENLKQFMEKYL